MDFDGQNPAQRLGSSKHCNLLAYSPYQRVSTTQEMVYEQYLSMSSLSIFLSRSGVYSVFPYSFPEVPYIPTLPARTNCHLLPSAEFFDTLEGIQPIDERKIPAPRFKKNLWRWKMIFSMLGSIQGVGNKEHIDMNIKYEFFIYVYMDTHLFSPRNLTKNGSNLGFFHNMCQTCRWFPTNHHLGELQRLHGGTRGSSKSLGSTTCLPHQFP